MKKLLTILSSFAITAAGASTVVACGDDKGDGDSTEDALTDKQKLDAVKTNLEANGVKFEVSENKKDTVVAKVKSEIEKDSISVESIVLKLGSEDLADGKLSSAKVNELTGTVVLKLNDEVTESFTIKVKVTFKDPKVILDTAKADLEALTGAKITMDLTGATVAKVTDEIKKNPRFIAIVDGKIIKLDGDLTLAKSKTDSAVPTDLTDGKTVYVSGKIKIEGVKDSEAFGFDAALKQKNADEKVAAIEEAQEKLVALKNVDIKISLTGIDSTKVIAEVKKNKSYSDIVKEKITLDGDLKLTSDEGLTTAVKTTEFVNDAILYVSGKIKHADKAEATADFKFTIKLVEDKPAVTPEQTLVNTKKDALNALSNVEIKMDLTSTTAAKVITEVKKNKSYSDIVKEKITLDGDLKLTSDEALATDAKPAELVNDAILYVSGKIKHADKAEATADFKFTIKLVSTGTTPVVDAEQDLVNTAKGQLEGLNEVEIKMDLTSTTAAKVITEVKKNTQFIAIVNDTTIKLDGDLKLAKDADGGKIEDSELTDTKVVHVIGKIKHGTKATAKADFKFTIKLVQKA